MPSLLTFGPYDAELRRGPAIWIRCLVDRSLPRPYPDTATPIIYLPEVSRQSLRAVESCPRPLQPLAELQYRGAFFSQQNARDWTLLSFLKSADGGLGLDVAQDARTLEAMARAALPLADTPIAALQGKRLEAADFDHLLAADPVRDLLRWLDDPPAAQPAWGEERWQAFRARCQAEFDFDPSKDGIWLAPSGCAAATAPGPRCGGALSSRRGATPSSPS